MNIIKEVNKNASGFLKNAILLSAFGSVGTKPLYRPTPCLPMDYDLDWQHYVNSDPYHYDYDESFGSIYDPYFRSSQTVSTTKATTTATFHLPPSLEIQGQVVDCKVDELTCYEYMDRASATEKPWKSPRADWFEPGSSQITVKKVFLQNFILLISDSIYLEFFYS